MTDRTELLQALRTASEIAKAEWDEKSEHPLKCAKCQRKIRMVGTKRGVGWSLCMTCYRWERRRVMKRAVVEALGDQCGACEQRFPFCCYDLHHVGEKVDAPSMMFAFSSLEKISDEVAKCVLLCANCHRIEHEELKSCR